MFLWAGFVCQQMIYEWMRQCFTCCASTLQTLILENWFWIAHNFYKIHLNWRRLQKEVHFTANHFLWREATAPAPWWTDRWRCEKETHPVIFVSTKVILASGYYAAFRVTLVAKELEGLYDGAIHITTDYEVGRQLTSALVLRPTLNQQTSLNDGRLSITNLCETGAVFLECPKKTPKNCKMTDWWVMLCDIKYLFCSRVELFHEAWWCMIFHALLCCKKQDPPLHGSRRVFWGGGEGPQFRKKCGYKI